MTAQPARYFAFGPYKAEAIGPCGWWGVKNKNGLNVLTFTDRPGYIRSQRFVNGRWVSPIPVDKNWAETVDEYVET